jgi:hypothetical protein
MPVGSVSSWHSLEALSLKRLASSLSEESSQLEGHTVELSDRARHHAEEPISGRLRENLRYGITFALLHFGNFLTGCHVVTNTRSSR